MPNEPTKRTRLKPMTPNQLARAATITQDDVTACIARVRPSLRPTLKAGKDKEKSSDD